MDISNQALLMLRACEFTNVDINVRNRSVHLEPVASDSMFTDCVLLGVSMPVADVEGGRLKGCRGVVIVCHAQKREGAPEAVVELRDGPLYLVPQHRMADADSRNEVIGELTRIEASLIKEVEDARLAIEEEGRGIEEQRTAQRSRLEGIQEQRRDLDASEKKDQDNGRQLKARENAITRKLRRFKDGTKQRETSQQQSDLEELRKEIRGIEAAQMRNAKESERLKKQEKRITGVLSKLNDRTKQLERKMGELKKREQRTTMNIASQMGRCFPDARPS